MASKSSKAAKAKAAEAARAARKSVSVWSIIVQFLFYILFTASLVVFASIALNCAYDKPFIPKSQGFCNDAVHLFTKYELRKTIGKNFGLTVNNFQTLVIDTATPYVVNATKSIDENLQKYGGEYYVKTVTFYNNTLGPHVQNLSELLSNLYNEGQVASTAAFLRVNEWFKINGPIYHEALNGYYRRVVDAVNNLVNAH
uniref:PHB domain-containing protein n=1 Tax=Panagrellus redivivus TaxID=6233 RepID=A0A7E4W7J6_PANRE